MVIEAHPPSLHVGRTLAIQLYARPRPRAGRSAYISEAVLVGRRVPRPARQCIPGTTRAYTIKSNSSLVTLIGFYLFFALSGHGSLPTSRASPYSPYIR